MQADATVDAAFLQILQQHERLVRKIAGLYADGREDREDLAGEIVLQLWRAFPGYRGEAGATTWLYRVALNTAINQLRKRSRLPARSHGEEILLQLPDVAGNTEADVQRLRSIIGQLPEVDRALVLLFLEDRSHAEIADIMGISVSNVGTRLSRIKARLKKIMTGV